MQALAKVIAVAPNTALPVYRAELKVSETDVRFHSQVLFTPIFGNVLSLLTVKT